MNKVNNEFNENTLEYRPSDLQIKTEIYRSIESNSCIPSLMQLCAVKWRVHRLSDRKELTKVYVIKSTN